MKIDTKVLVDKGIDPAELPAIVRAEALYDLTSILFPDPVKSFLILSAMSLRALGDLAKVDRERFRDDSPGFQKAMIDALHEEPEPQKLDDGKTSSTFDETQLTDEQKQLLAVMPSNLSKVAS